MANEIDFANCIGIESGRIEEVQEAIAVGIGRRRRVTTHTQ